MDGTVGEPRYAQEVLRIVQALPNWRPARDAQGTPVAMREYVQVSLPSGTVTTGRPAIFKPSGEPKANGEK